MNRIASPFISSIKGSRECTESSVSTVDEDFLCRHLRDVRLHHSSNHRTLCSTACLVAAGRIWRRKHVDSTSVTNNPLPIKDSQAKRFVLRPSRLKLVATRRNHIQAAVLSSSSTASFCDKHVPLFFSNYLSFASIDVQTDDRKKRICSAERVFGSSSMQLTFTKPVSDVAVYDTFTNFESLKLENVCLTDTINSLPNEEASMTKQIFSALPPLTEKGASQPLCDISLESASYLTEVGDLSAEELAGYLDEIVRLPKKMSTMAEMMYA